MAIHNVVQMKQYAAYNLDQANRTAVATVDLDNGCVFTLKEYSDVAGQGTVWNCEQATATSTMCWMAMAPEVVAVEPVDGLVIRGITPDPRAFTNVANKPFDAVLLYKGDIIEMTGAGINGIDTAEYLVPSAANFMLETATAAGTGLTLHKIGTSRLHIGNAALIKTPVTTYKFEVVNN